MKLHVLSDVHLEFGRWPRADDVNAVDADVTVLAGDIGAGLLGIDWALTFRRPVIYVCGNHEFYGKRPMPKLWRKARQKVSGTHVHLLENEAAVMDGVRFLGATLWTDFCLFGVPRQQLAMQSAQTGMNDYAQIIATDRPIRRLNETTGASRYAGDPLTACATLSMHQQSRAFLECELNAGHTGKLVVVTHHAPSVKSLRYGEPRGLLDAAYASHLDDLVDRAALWIHGHTHLPVDYRIGNGRVVSNPRGYVRYETIARFNPGFVVEV
ncbi:metallophosphoesterase family protein [Bordetella sp. N]|uniref:metallophosphoesterase n=1 Tax=Bordetella sp. N TaxID=1746199 RepID=UPI000708CC73|nr:metallophosphoesterase family protein [Bordetella sp. N]ALM81837.1 hypothetical protein ASB57_01635 [Bordetella sp. N]